MYYARNGVHGFIETFKENTLDPFIAADLRPSADGSSVRTSLVAGGG